MYSLFILLFWTVTRLSLSACAILAHSLNEACYKFCSFNYAPYKVFPMETFLSTVPLEIKICARCPSGTLQIMNMFLVFFFRAAGTASLPFHLNSPCFPKSGEPPKGHAFILPLHSIREGCAGAMSGTHFSTWAKVDAAGVSRCADGVCALVG